MNNPINYTMWNPWHGCVKVSPGCKFCYVYNQDQMYGVEQASSQVRKTLNFNLPVKHKRDKSWKIPPQSVVFTCFTSDFLVEEADPWRQEVWCIMQQRSDCTFFIITKRIDRLEQQLPDDWGQGYPNVIIGCTVENQAMANYRLPIFMRLPIQHKTIVAAPLLQDIDLTPFLDYPFEEISVSGESGPQARICHYDWVLHLRQQSIEHNIPFRYFQTGARLLKDGRLYYIRRCLQTQQAQKANINYRIGQNLKPIP